MVRTGVITLTSDARILARRTWRYVNGLVSRLTLVQPGVTKGAAIGSIVALS